MVDEMESQLFNFGVNGVMDIKFYLEGTPLNVRVLGNLYRDYASITVAQVAKSCLWYAVVPDDPVKKLFAQNLEWSYEYLCNSMTDSLKEHCLQAYRKHPEAERGGPLLLKKMMDALLTNTREAANHLVDSLLWDEQIM